ncbi:hypothetical protein [Frigoriglobus tundricola]|uniref:Gram-positive cocci surface proteins LPxTG domain-containing protein n=1 Tax=Frigoriglobus tundricola TaxID=2774151 RepID=A0A6M5YS60_9BACT|nr:hypothetical protein [Frigoriglobus tundricola]QJW96838.1 hypothetical protein FTUN_4398 [Frigoriglobus tundricola]
MNRLLTLLTVGAIAGSAVADVPPPPPPKGKKYVSVSNEVVLGKDVTGYVFVQRVSTGPGAPRFTYEKLELTTEKAVAMAVGGRRTFVTLIAVPQDAAKEFKTDAELFAALGAKKVKGDRSLEFAGTATVPDTVKAESVKWTYTITAIDPKDGIKTKVEGEGAEKPGKKEKPPTPGVSWMAGGAAALAALLGGFWLAGRARRKA